MTMFGIIAGTGFETLDELDLKSERKAPSAWGPPSAPVQVGTLGDTEVLFLSRHG